MKVIQANRGEGYAKLEIEDSQDLWYLKDVISEGHRVRSLTQRTKRDGRDKKTLKLTLEVEKTEYRDDRLRVTGEITEGDEDIELGYHTFNLEEGSTFEIKGQLTQSQWDKIEEAERAQNYEVVFCLVQKGEADLFLVKETGIERLSNVKENVPGKMYKSEEELENFQKEVASILNRISDRKIVLAGPGFQKESIYEQLNEETKEKTLVKDTSVIGKTGLQEAIKRGALKEITKRSRISKETQDIEEMLERLKKDEKIALGKDEISKMAELGAIEKLLATKEALDEHPELENKVEQNGGSVEIIHTDHEAGQRLENLGGMAALLRFEAN